MRVIESRVVLTTIHHRASYHVPHDDHCVSQTHKCCTGQCKHLINALVVRFQTENNADPDAIKLDDEMAKVFGSSEHYNRKEQQFDIKQLSDAADPPPSLKANRSESDFAAVRKSHPVSAMRRRDSEHSGHPSAMATSPASQRIHAAYQEADDDDEPLVSERARADKQHDSDSQDDLRRVKFSETGSPPDQRTAATEANEADDSYDEEQLEDLRKRKG